MEDILVIRFSSLGDLCILGASLARLAVQPGAEDRRVTVVTKAAFVPLMESFQGVDRVHSLAGSDWRSLRLLAKTLKSERWDRIIDAHGTLRSHFLLTMIGRRPQARLAKDTAARLAFLKFRKRSESLERTMSGRFDDLFHFLAPGDDSGSWMVDEPDSPAFLEIEPDAVGQEPILGLAPGAQWEAKQWPEQSFAEFLTSFRQKFDTPVRIFLGPREERWFPGSRLEEAASHLAGIHILRGLSQVEIIGPLARCTLLVTNDSGLLHLAEAAGTPVLAMFGPTVREFGYFPRHRGSRVLEVPLECRPCSRNGKRSCHREDLACLASISVAETTEAVLEMAEWGPLHTPPGPGNANQKEDS